MFFLGAKNVVRAMTVHFLLAIMLGLQVTVIFMSFKGILFPGNETISAIASCCAQIIAGLYGITLAGYTFFLSRMDALMASDMTLDYIIHCVKNRFKYIIWFISFNVLMTLFTSIFLMYCPVPEEQMHSFLYRLFCNEFIVFFGTSIVMIVYYSLKVVEPNCLEKEAQRQKKKFCRGGKEDGNVLEFIAMYDEIEEKCNAMIPENVLLQLHENKGSHFEYTIELLDRTSPKMHRVLSEIKWIHRYYECVINCAPMSVSQEMCNKAKTVLAYLKDKIN